MDTLTSERKMITATKNYIKTLTKSISKEVNSIRKNADYECIEAVDRILGQDWIYFEKKFFNEDKLRERCLSDTGYFNYNELCEEVDEYIRVYVWYRGYMKFIDEGELT